MPQVPKTLDLPHDASSSPSSSDLNLDIPDTAVQDSNLSAHLNLGSVENEVISLNKAEGAISKAAVSEACFEDFKSQVAHVTKLSGIRRDRTIGNAFRSCSPTNCSSWRYNFMVIKHLTELKCDPMPVFRKISAFEIPPFYTAESRDLLNCLQKTYWQFPASRLYYLQLYKKVAESASHAEVATDPSQDLEILLLIRQFWQSARTQGVREENSIIQLLQTLVCKIKDDKNNRWLQSILVNVSDADHVVIRLVVCASTMANWLPIAENILSCLPQERLIIYTSSITSQLIRMIRDKSQISKSTYKCRLSTWLELLHRLDTTSLLHQSGPGLLEMALARVSKHVFAFNIPIYVGSDSLLCALLTKLSHQHTYQSTKLERMFELINSLSNIRHDRVTRDTIVNSLAIIFSRMKHESLPYQDLLESFIVLTSQHAGLGVVLQLLIVLDRETLTLRDFSILDRLIAGKVSAIQRPIHRSSEAQRQGDALALHTCRRIFEILSKMCSSTVTSSPIVTKGILTTMEAKRQIQVILNRAEAEHMLPLEFRNLSVDMPAQQRVHLIHQLAYYCSLNTTRTHLANWRTMYYLYRHLREHSLPIGPSFTKAVVRVSLIRPLIECRFVSARRLIWVCKLVAWVEGEDVAKGIEQDFWVWRGDLIKYAKGVYVRAGGDYRAKAHLGTMKRVKLI